MAGREDMAGKAERVDMGPNNHHRCDGASRSNKDNVDDVLVDVLILAAGSLPAADKVPVLPPSSREADLSGRPTRDLTEQFLLAYGRSHAIVGV